MKTITDEIFEQNRDELGYLYEEYKEYAVNAKIAASKSIKFYLVNWGLTIVFALLFQLLKWEFLAKLDFLFTVIAMFGGLAIGFYFKGVKPVFKMFKYYWSTITEKTNAVGGFFGLIPFVGWFLNFCIMLFDIWVFSAFVAIWIGCSPLTYYWAHRFFIKLSKKFEEGLDIFDKRQANNFASVSDEQEK